MPKLAELSGALGRDLYPVIVTLMHWGDQYLAGDDGPPLVLEHHCGHHLTAQVICEACGEPLRPSDTKPLRATDEPYPPASQARQRALTSSI